MLDFLEDIDDGVEKMKALEKQIEDEHGVYPCHGLGQQLQRT